MSDSSDRQEAQDVRATVQDTRASNQEVRASTQEGRAQDQEARAKKQELRNDKQDARTEVQEAAAGEFTSLRVLLVLMLIGMLVISAVGLMLKDAVDDGYARADSREQSRFEDNEATERRAAESRFLNCFLARDDLLMADETVAADIEVVCDGFTTLANAYTTIGVTPTTRPN